MDFNIITEKEQPLLSREELKVELIFEGVTPSRKEIIDKCAQVKKADKKLIIVKSIYNLFGKHQADVSIRIYKDADKLAKFEKNLRATKEAEATPAEEKPAEKKPAEKKPAEEKPAEEKPSEEKPSEEKPSEEKPADNKKE